MTAPFFSIAVTTYRRPELLREALSSIRDQTFGDFEVIVGNDYPTTTVTAGSVGFDDPRFRFVNHATNLGEIVNMNVLLGLSRGRYFTWLADDDLYAPDFLEHAQEALLAYALPRCVFTAYTGNRRELDPSSAVRTVEFSGPQFLAAFLDRSIKVLGCCGVFDVTYLRSVGGMTQLGDGFSPYSDVLLGMQCGQLDRVVYVDKPGILFRSHGGSVSATSDDLRAYRTAQEQLCATYVSLYQDRIPTAAFRSNLFTLLRTYCVGFYYSVVRRAGSVGVPELVRFLAFVASYARLLGADRWRLVAITAFETLRLMGWFTRRRLSPFRSRA